MKDNLDNIKNYIIDYINNFDSDCSNINWSGVIKVLFNQKILFYNFNKLIKDCQDVSTLCKCNQIQLHEKMFKLKYTMLFSKIIILLNSRNIDYIVYKGLILEHLIKTRRLFNDIDLILHVDDYQLFIETIRKEYDIVEIIGNGLLSKEIKIRLIWKNEVYTIEIKKSNQGLAIINFDEVMEIDISGVKCKTFNLEMTLIILINYFYYYSENLTSLLYADRLILKYPVEIYAFIKNNIDEIKWDKVMQLCLEYKVLHKFNYYFESVKDYIFDPIINRLSKIFRYNNNYKLNSNIFFERIDWDFSLFERYFIRNQIKSKIQSVYSPKYYLEPICIKKNMNLFNENIYSNGMIINWNSFINYNKIIVEILFKGNVLQNNRRFVFIKIYAYNKEREFIFPFIGLGIFIERGSIYVSETKTFINYENDKIYCDCIRNILDTANYNQYTINKNKLKISIDSEFYGINISDRIGIKIYLFEYDCEKKIIKDLLKTSNNDYLLIIKRRRHK